MDRAISNLITILGLQRDIYTNLYELSKKKREAIEKQDVNELDKIVKDEQPLLFMLTENERERKNVMAELSKKMDIPADDITLQAVVDICPAAFLGALKRVRTELTNIIKEQVSINELNRRLLESRLEYISFMLDSNRGDFNNAYNDSGTDARVRTRGPSVIDFGV